MNPKIIIFLLLLAGVGTKAKAEGTVGRNLINFTAYDKDLELLTYVVPPGNVVKDAERQTIEAFLCTEDQTHGINCQVSLNQFRLISERLISESLIRITPNELSLLLPELGKNGAIIGALVASAVLGILEVWELMYKVLRYPEDSQRARGALPMHRFESAVDVWRAHPPFARNLVKWLLPTMVKVTVAALFGAGIGAIAGGPGLLSRPPKIVTVLLETTYPQSHN